MASAKIRPILERNGWFRQLDPALSARIINLGVVRRLKDEPIYRMSEAANGFFALLSGEVRIVHTTQDGRSGLVFVAGPGGWFGETAMIDGEPRSSDAVAVGETQVLQLTPAAFQALTADNVAHYAAFARLVCYRYRRAIDRIISSPDLPLPVRLAQTILGLMHGHGGEGGAIDLRLSQETLGGMVGVSRQSLNGAVGRLRRLGLIEMRYGAVSILDPAGLERLARSRTAPDLD